MLKERMKLTVALVHRLEEKNEKCVAVVTGGMAEQCGITEAQVMSQLLVKDGISESKIILEDKALTTVQNALYTYDLLRELGITKAIIVTSSFHMERSQKLFKWVFKDAIHLEFESHTPPLTGEEYKRELEVEKKRLERLGNDLRMYTD